MFLKPVLMALDHLGMSIMQFRLAFFQLRDHKPSVFDVPVDLFQFGFAGFYFIRIELFYWAEEAIHLLSALIAPKIDMQARAVAKSGLLASFSQPDAALLDRFVRDALGHQQNLQGRCS